MTASGPVTPTSDEAPAGDTAQGFQETKTSGCEILMHRARCDKSDGATLALAMGLHSAWLAEMQMLSACSCHLGIGPDLAAVTLEEAWGLFRFLSRADKERCE